MEQKSDLLLIPDKITVANDLIKTVYAGLLSQFNRNEVAGFIRNFKVSEAGNVLSLDILLKKIWREGGEIPLQFQIDFLGMAEAFIIDRGLDPEVFRTKVFSNSIAHPVIPARKLLFRLKPFFDLFFSARDLRLLCLKLLPHIFRGGPASKLHQIVFQSIRYGQRKDVIMFSWGNYSGLESEFDYESWILPIIKRMPNYLDLPSFEFMHMLADTRSIKNILSNTRLVENEKGLFLNNELLAVPCKFQDIYKGYGMELESFKLENKKCMKVVKDYFCPYRNRIVLHKDTVYEAPTFLIELKYASVQGRSMNPLGRIVEGLIEPKISWWNQIQEIHECLLEELTNITRVVYYSENDSITVNDHHLVRNVPAKILRNILREYTHNGRVRFENREFKRDSEICMDMSNPNFEGRLNRLIEKLEKDSPEMRIEKTQRGSFEFRVQNMISFREF
jgi:hypothetical protein